MITIYQVEGTGSSGAVEATYYVLSTKEYDTYPNWEVVGQITLAMTPKELAQEVVNSISTSSSILCESTIDRNISRTCEHLYQKHIIEDRVLELIEGAN